MKKKIKKINSQLIPLTTERATSLAASSYTSLVPQSDLNTLSITKSQKKKGNKLYTFISVYHQDL
jgi:hypothetical protein